MEGKEPRRSYSLALMRSVGSLKSPVSLDDFGSFIFAGWAGEVGGLDFNLSHMFAHNKGKVN